MRRNRHNRHLALTLCGLMTIALVLLATGLFGDANPVGMGIFLGLFLGVPAAFFAILALSSLAAKPLCAGFYWSRGRHST